MCSLLLIFLCVNTAAADTCTFPNPGDPQQPPLPNLRKMLNERQAGQHGPLRLSSDGNDIVRRDGLPIRRCGTCSGVDGDELETPAAVMIECLLNCNSQVYRSLMIGGSLWNRTKRSRGFRYSYR